MDEQKLASLLLSHQLASEDFGKDLANKIVRLLNSTDEQLMQTIAGRYALIEKNGKDRGPATTKRLEDMLEGIRKINSEVYSKIADETSERLTDAAKHEMATTLKMLSKAGAVDFTTTLPDAAFIKNLVETSPIPVSNNGVALLRPWVDGMEKGRFDRLEGRIRQASLTGETTDQLAQSIRGTKANNYQDGLLNVSRQSAQTFAITANSSVQNNARLESFRKLKSIKFVEISAVLDLRTSSICQGHSGKIYPIDAPHPSPPFHPRCFPGSTKVSTANGAATINNIRGVSKRWYDGDMVVITTASGKELTCTPNHPILTEKGFVAANSLAVGDDVISYFVGDGVLVSNDDHKHGVALIEEVADAFFASSKVSTAEVPLTAEHFHGDISDGDIAVVGSNRSLSFADQPPVGKASNKVTLQLSNMALLAPSPFGLLTLHDEMDRLTTHGSIGFGGKPLPVREACARHTGELLFTLVTDMDASLSQPGFKGTCSQTHALPHLCKADPALIKADSLCKIDLNQTPPFVEHTFGDENLPGSFGIDPILGRAILNGETGEVVGDKIRKVKSVEFHGYVYNLDTDDGHYQAEGLIVHNCRTILVPRRNDTDPPKHQPYHEWIAGKSPEDQDTALGKTKAELFRKGKLDLKDLYRNDGKPKTLDELKASDAKLLDEPKKVEKSEPLDTKKIDDRERNYVLAKGEETGNEHLVAYEEKTGEVIERKEGDRSSVHFSPKLVAALNDPANAIVLHHNHPSSSSLSLPDMQVVTQRPGARGIWAHGANGSAFYAERGKKAFTAAAEKRIEAGVRKALQGLINLGSLKIEDASILHNHLIWTVMNKIGQIVYRADLKGESAAAFERNRTIFEQILENLK